MKRIFLLFAFLVPSFFSYIHTQSWKSQFDEVGVFSEGFAIVKKSNKYGYVNEEGKLIIPVLYDYIGPVSEGLIHISRNKKSGFANTKGNIIVDPVYEVAGDFKNGFAAVQKDRKIGYVNSTGRLVIPTLYDSYNDFSEGLVLVRQSKKYGFLNGNGEIVVPLAYDEAESFSEDRALVCREGKCGYIDRAGNEIIKLRFEGARSFSNGLAAVRLNRKAGFIDKQGQVIIPIDYDIVYSFSQNGLSLVVKDTLSWFINKRGEDAHAKKYLYAVEYSGDKAFVYHNNKFLFINTKGEPLNEKRYDTLIYYNESLGSFAVVSGSEYLFLNREGKDISKYKYESIKLFSDRGDLLLRANRKYGLLSNKGSFLLDIKYDDIFAKYYEGKANSIMQIWFKENEKWGVTDSVKSFFTNPRYDYPLRRKPIYWLNIVYSGRSAGLVDSTGREIAEPIYEIPHFERAEPDNAAVVKYFAVKSSGKWGIMDWFGKIVLPLEYDRIDTRMSARPDILAAVLKNGKWGFVDMTNGRLVIECAYDNNSYDPFPKFEKGGEFIFLSKGGLKGAFNKAGKNIVPVEYESISIYDNEIWAQKKERGINYRFVYSTAGNILRNEKVIYMD